MAVVAPLPIVRLRTMGLMHNGTKTNCHSHVCWPVSSQV
jgi:hypothetical protein